MIRRLASFLLLPLLLVLTDTVGGATAQTAVLPVSIDVNGNRIALAPSDADAFLRRVNRPPLLKSRPLAAEPSYVVVTSYWDEAARREDDEPDVSDEAEYFPNGGFVRARQEGLSVWLVLDLGQRATLDRYIRFGTATDNPSSTPSALQLIAFAAQTEVVGIEAGNRLFTESERVAFWSAAASIARSARFVDPPRSPAIADEPGYWLTFSLPEGRAQQYFVNTTAGTLTDALGTESYQVPDLIGGVLPDSAEALVIEHDDPAGSQLWWLLAAAGGATLFALAFWRRRARGRT